MKIRIEGVQVKDQRGCDILDFYDINLVAVCKDFIILRNGSRIKIKKSGKLEIGQGKNTVGVYSRVDQNAMISRHPGASVRLFVRILAEN
jgi:hypothetical protein